MRIGIDFDSTIAKIDEPWLNRLNSLCGTAYKPEEWVDWDLNFLNPQHRSVFFTLFTPDIYESVAPYPGAPEAIRRLAQEPDVELVCVTSNPERNGPAFTEAKRRWLQRHVPELSDRVLPAKSKSGLGLDILIDDAPHHHAECDYVPVLIKRPWNTSVVCAHSFERWSDGKDLLLKLIKDYRWQKHGYGRLVSTD